MNKPPEPKSCPQCTSMFCGPISCRFSGLQHEKVVKLPGEHYYGPEKPTKEYIWVKTRS